MTIILVKVTCVFSPADLQVYMPGRPANPLGVKWWNRAEKWNKFPGLSSLYWSFLGYCFYILKVYLCSKAELQKAREHHFLSYVTWKQSKKLLSLMHFQKSLHILKSHRFQLLIELSKWKPLLLLPWQGCLCYFSTLLSVWRLQCPNTIL